jgi:hypothetical protein
MTSGFIIRSNLPLGRLSWRLPFECALRAVRAVTQRYDRRFIELNPECNGQRPGRFYAKVRDDI